MKGQRLPWLLTAVCTLFYSCVMDRAYDVVAVKNERPDTILIAHQEKPVITDSILYNERIVLDQILPNKSYTIRSFNRRPDALSDSVKYFIYSFNLDSVKRFKKKKKDEGVFQHSIIKKYVFQINNAKEPIDTIFIK